MSDIMAGILLPQDILMSPAFTAFSLFVALNTIIYLGLTLAKFVPWPTQVRPATVRRLLPVSIEEDRAMRSPSRPAPQPNQDPLRSLRWADARQTIPVALGLTGALTVIVGLINSALFIRTFGPSILVGMAFGLALIVLAQVLTRARLRDSTVIWTWAIAMLVITAEISWRATIIDSAVLLAYPTIVLMLIAPISMSWAAGITGATLGAIIISIAGSFVSLVDTVSWTIAAITAAIASLVLLRLRVASLTRILKEQQRADALASTDPVTGAFSRTGLLALAPTVAEAALTSGMPVTVVMCRVEDMAAINQDYGFEYGDEVLSTTVRAMSATLPEGTLVSRWGSQDLLGLLAGKTAPADSLETEIERQLAVSGIALGKRPVRTGVGTAEGDPGSVTLEELVAQAQSGLASSPPGETAPA